MADGSTFHEEEALGKAYDARLMRRLLRYLRPYVGYVVLALVLLLLSAAAAIVGPWLTQLVIDEISAAVRDEISRSAVFEVVDEPGYDVLLVRGMLLDVVGSTASPSCIPLVLVIASPAN